MRRKIVQLITKLLRALTPEPKVIETTRLRTGVKVSILSDNTIVVDDKR